MARVRVKVEGAERNPLAAVISDSNTYCNLLSKTDGSSGAISSGRRSPRRQARPMISSPPFSPAGNRGRPRRRRASRITGHPSRKAARKGFPEPPVCPDRQTGHETRITAFPPQSCRPFARSPHRPAPASPSSRFSPRPETQDTDFAWREAQASANSKVFTKHYPLVTNHCFQEVFTNHETRNTKHGFFQTRNTAFFRVLRPSGGEKCRLGCGEHPSTRIEP